MADPTPLAAAMSDNIALRHIVALTKQMIEELSRDYLGIYGNNAIAVTSGMTTLRAADAASKMAIVINLGETTIDVFEESNKVAHLLPGEEWVSTLLGKGAISAKTTTGSSIASVATYVATAVDEIEDIEIPAPAPVDDSEEFMIVYPSISGPGGLETVPTVGFTNRLYWVLESGITRGWRLTDGELESDLASGVWRPLDYATDNQKNFLREI